MPLLSLKVFVAFPPLAFSFVGGAVALQNPDVRDSRNDEGSKNGDERRHVWLPPVGLVHDFDLQDVFRKRHPRANHATNRRTAL